MAGFLRKMSLDGFLVKLNLDDVKEMMRLLRLYGNNLNQLAKRVNATGRFYDADMEDLLQKQEQLWDAVNQIITRLAEIR